MAQLSLLLYLEGQMGPKEYVEDFGNMVARD